MDDLISRRAAIKVASGYCHPANIAKELARLPSAQPDVPDTNVGDLISRQAAIDSLHMHLMYRMGTDSNKKRLDEWINNLPSAQPEPCEDAVSRKDAIRWVKTECNPYGKPTLDFESGKKVIEYLKRMPPVTPERKKGKWIDKSGGIEGAWNYCSVCDEQAIDLYDFCPNCGADMRGNE